MNQTHNDIEWIFFDVGNTLLDETAAWDEEFGRLSTRLSELGRPTPVADIWAEYRRACREFDKRQWRAVCQKFAASREEARAFERLNADWRFDLEMTYPNVESTLAALAGKYKLGIIANQSLGTRQRMEKHGLLPYLSLVIGSAEAGVLKPDPAIFELALREAGCSSEHAAMVGDRIDNDVRPAKSLGMKTIHVRQGGCAVQQPRDDADVPSASIDHIGDLTPALISNL